MTVTTSKTQPAGSNPGNPALTEKETLRLGYSKDEYRQARHWRRLTVEHHMSCGTLRPGWYPPGHVGRSITDPFIDDATVDLVTRLDGEVDPELELSQASIEVVKTAALDELEGRTDPLLTPESGRGLLPRGRGPARSRPRREDRDRRAGQQAPPPPSWATRAQEDRARVPWAAPGPGREFIGFLWFCAVWLNVPILQPWLDFGAGSPPLP